MIIKKVVIENFLCYYDKKEFVFADGLNIILGENGEGKTKFYEALVWLFNGNVRDLKSLISAKKLTELEENNSFKVEVKIQVEQHEVIKQVRRFFRFEKKGNDVNTYNYSLEGIKENAKGEREVVDGNTLLEEIFPSRYRKYSMFKGESELNIFNETESLKDLIDTFSFAKYYRKYIESINDLEVRISKNISRESNKSKKQKKEYERLEAEIDSERRNLRDFKSQLKLLNSEYEKSINNIKEIESNAKNAEAVEYINKRINTIVEKINGIKRHIDQNYTKLLFDEKWILVHFEPIFNEFTHKITQLDSERRKLLTEHNIEIGKKQQIQETTAQLLKGKKSLPMDTPSKDLMQEMLNEEHCKVCNRKAEKGSEAYEFMLKKLEEFLKSLAPKNHEKYKPLYKYNYLKRIEGIRQNQERNLYNVKKIENEIQSRIEFNEARRYDLKTLNEKLSIENDDKIKILSQANQTESSLLNLKRNYSAFIKTTTNTSAEIPRLEIEIEKTQNIINGKIAKRDTIDRKTSQNYLNQTRDVIRDIAIIFKDTEKRKFNEFLEILEEKSNRIFSEINVDAFMGIIKFKLNANKEVRIELQEANGRIFARPNQSLLTSKYLSILFAISELTKENNDESFPMIFDAPTSSFGETKTAQFFNLLNNTPGQKILLIKDFLVKDSANNLVIKEEFKKIKRDKAIWVKLERPFDEQKLHTINSQVIHL